MSTIMHDDHRPAFDAVLHFPPGIDRNDLTVTDESGQIVAATSWRPTQGLGKPTWDAALAELGYARSSPWAPFVGGFRADVEPIGGRL